MTYFINHSSVYFSVLILETCSPIVDGDYPKDPQLVEVQRKRL